MCSYKSFLLLKKSEIRKSAAGPRDVIRLVRFFIFNSSFGPKEGEEAKRIIFYHTDNEDEEKEEQKTKQVKTN